MPDVVVPQRQPGGRQPVEVVSQQRVEPLLRDGIGVSALRRELREGRAIDQIAHRDDTVRALGLHAAPKLVTDRHGVVVAALPGCAFFLRDRHRTGVTDDDQPHAVTVDRNTQAWVRRLGTQGQ